MNINRYGNFVRCTESVYRAIADDGGARRYLYVYDVLNIEMGDTACMNIMYNNQDQDLNLLKTKYNIIYYMFGKKFKNHLKNAFWRNNDYTK